MEFIPLLQKYWWVIIIFLIGVFINHLVELSKVDHKKYIKRNDQPTENDHNENKGKREHKKP